jgi:predicted Fe-S protein YdhL (DUF1289 family)
MPEIATPCLKICVLDPAGGLCRGCGRSGDEIAAWRDMPQSERLRIMALLPARLAALGVAAPLAAGAD